jgi:hypothetical protein
MLFAKQDVYINVVGHMHLDQNMKEGHASDLAVGVSLVSSFMSIPVRGDTAFVGEVGLLGELRAVPAIEKRIQEARRMGFSRIVTPRVKGARRSGGSSKPNYSRSNGIDWIQCDTLLDAINEGLVVRLPKGRRRRGPKSVAGEKESERSAGPLLETPPGSLDKLMLGNIITDDENDEYDEGRAFW